jgi:hypothetical protein
VKQRSSFIGRKRKSEDGDRSNLLVCPLWHVGRSIRHSVDGQLPEGCLTMPILDFRLFWFMPRKKVDGINPKFKIPKPLPKVVGVNPKSKIG